MFYPQIYCNRGDNAAGAAYLARNDAVGGGISVSDRLDTYFLCRRKPCLGKEAEGGKYAARSLDGGTGGICAVELLTGFAIEMIK